MWYAIVGMIFMGVVAIWANNLAQHQRVSPEVARKLVHLLLGIVFVAVSYMSSRTATALLMSVGLAAVLVARETGVFTNFRKVGRSTNGDIYYPIGGLVALVIADSQPSFAIGILVLAIADTVATIVGKSRGKHHFEIMGDCKTIEGSLSFAFTVVLVGLCYVLFGPSYLAGNYLLLVVLPLVLTPVEALCPRGIDNLLLPVIATLLVNALS